MRGASFLTGLGDAAVIDIGGTTTDIGMLVGGFPRSRAEGAEIAGVKTNFRVPDVFSFGLGGGSVVRRDGANFTMGPDSVGYRLTQKARVFAGDLLTTTDIAVAAGQANLGQPELVADLDKDFVDQALARMKKDIETAVDRMKPGPEPIPAILVGGGSILVEGGLEVCSEVVRPDHFGSANAIGAAIAQVSGEVDAVISMEGRSRDEALAEAIKTATDRAVEAGADPQSIDVADITETPLAYLPGNAVRIAAKVVGSLSV
jgi:N-methylhydantoinase A/oxoprolinase/acetone carboxylase beta subunit